MDIHTNIYPWVIKISLPEHELARRLPAEGLLPAQQIGGGLRGLVDQLRFTGRLTRQFTLNMTVGFDSFLSFLFKIDLLDG